MFIGFKIERDILIVILRGELDHNSSEEVRLAIDEKIDSCIVNNLIFDFSGVTFMDSSGIGVVIGRFRKIRYKDGTVLISSVNKNINKIFELSGLYKVINKYDTVEEAIMSI